MTSHEKFHYSLQSRTKSMTIFFSMYTRIYSCVFSINTRMCNLILKLNFINTILFQSSKKYALCF